ncbi:dihydromonapterin reductase [Photobacterium gaetbulicola]|uniref:Dihydromonapterin reductase n=1 Tax=Photobacterium gaetbulicola TaxID=1295392 RepID=A0A0B9GWF9_9GAMM|nr:dihydromonapterin reductase [Photobacterium gaetbulicola]KHT63071.1 dihydromonapterin reductase [Photobacterium gaetbulicola]
MSQVVVITGIGKRLGFQLAQTLQQEGYQVVGTYRTEYPTLSLLRELGAHLHQVDFYHQEQVDRFIALLLQHYPTLRAVIHNASEWRPDPNGKHNIHATAADVMHRMMTVHAAVPYQVNLALQDRLRENGHADIIHIGDFVAEKGSKKHIAYAASKAAMNNLTLSFASLLAPNVNVNSISPALLKFNPEDDETYKQKALAKALLPREAGFNEIIEGVKMLLNSRFMTGRNLQFDGGRHLK